MFGDFVKAVRGTLGRGGELLSGAGFSQNRDALETLFRHTGIRKVRFEKLPTRDFHYPEFVAEGNPEFHRFVMTSSGGIRDPESRQALEQLEHTLKEARALYYGSGNRLLGVIEESVPRMEIREQREHNTLYSNYRPFLVVARGEGDALTGFVVKPDVVTNMCWFKLRDDEMAALVEAFARR